MRNPTAPLPTPIPTPIPATATPQLREALVAADKACAEAFATADKWWDAVMVPADKLWQEVSGGPPWREGLTDDRRAYARIESAAIAAWRESRSLACKERDEAVAAAYAAHYTAVSNQTK